MQELTENCCKKIIKKIKDLQQAKNLSVERNRVSSNNNNTAYDMKSDLTIRKSVMSFVEPLTACANIRRVFIDLIIYLFNRNT